MQGGSIFLSRIFVTFFSMKKVKPRGLSGNDSYITTQGCHPRTAFTYIGIASRANKGRKEDLRIPPSLKLWWTNVNFKS